MKVLYNEERKRQFIKQYTENDGSLKVLRSRFNQIGKYEAEFEKDLCDFTTELRELFVLIPSRTTKSIEWLYNVIKTYCDWCIRNGYSKTNINPTIFIDKSDLEGFVSKIAQKYQWIMSRDELYEICDMLYNPRDKATLAMIFEGIRGRANKKDSFEELLNLQNKHVHEKECIIEAHRNDGTVRFINVDPRTMQYVLEAIEATEYYEGNGQHPRGKVTPLVESDYVLRGIKSLKYDTVEPNRTIITNIFRIIKKHADMPFINAIKTFQSGMLVTCVKMEEEKGRPLETADYVNIVTMKFGQLDSVAYSLKQMHMKFKELIKEE
jgi:hypothetical protein